ncbi:MAG: hypothetical protein CMG76_00375 [Candidatus Marinimicrobia bacterium]|nr:hypothetical protein [Candidatus Neomarinimicrobiota bacterium]
MEIISQNLTKFSTIRTKSFAKYFCTVNDINDLKAVFKFISENNHNYVVLGNGSNILFSKERYDDIVFIKLSGDFEYFVIKDRIANIGAAYSLKSAGKELIKSGYQDYIFFNLIPACIGGAVAQNAGTGLNEEIKDVCISVKLYDIKKNDIVEYENKSFKFDYRNSIIKKIPGRYVVLSAKFDLKNKTSNIEVLLNDMKDRISEKINREPSGYTFGSTFINNQLPAWKCVEHVKKNLKYSAGAFFSKKHQNWIINNNSKGKEIDDLIKETQKYVKSELSIDLKTEVRII